MHEIQHGILHVDRGFFFTIKELFTRPGDSIREYIEGKRVDHFKPVAFLLILSTVYAFLSKPLNDSSFIESAIMGFKSVPGNKNAPNTYVVIDWILAHYAYTSLLIIPIASLASYVAFVKSKYNYFQHLVLNSFQWGQTTVFHIVYLFITYLINKNNPNYTLDYIEIAIGFLLTYWTYYQFFDTMSSVRKIALTLVSYILFIIFIIAFSIILLFIFKA
ncbi:DUF3667 domain-containing protein [Fibrella forsythiae]|uniref:DUF3667 domain-containing protein n=1 Tax=Fibrella forsythiae TaxID=2817061 RepID=A0ABS3JQE7_9BACT|nr:DUF3667 domain-containing protein [Fibrella forsythiae]MBO0951601.1 DUF3667 domain-containing protein [Fibrella forsythiae]